MKRERKNRPGQKFGAKKKSWVWTWFVQDLSDPNVAVCDYCGKIITRMPSDKGLPKKLSEHLKTHKLNKDLINTTRPIPIDGNGITYTLGGLQMPYLGTFLPSSNGHMLVDLSQQMMGMGLNMGQNMGLNIGLNMGQSMGQNMGQNMNQNMNQNILGLNMLSQGGQSLSMLNQNMLNQNIQGQNMLGQNIQNQNIQGQNIQGQPILLNIQSDSIGPMSRSILAIQAIDHADDDLELKKKFRRGDRPVSVQYGRRFVLPNFDNTPYLASKFHRHLLKFLADNKLSIRLLKLHLFQQLIYDLRPDLIADLLELTGLYLSFVEVSRVDTDGEQEGHDALMAEANVVNTLAQELIKK